MSNEIAVKTETVAEMAEDFLLTAEDLEARGWVASVVLKSERARGATVVYQGASGGLRFVIGSRSLFKRYCRQTGAAEV